MKVKKVLKIMPMYTNTEYMWHDAALIDCVIWSGLVKDTPNWINSLKIVCILPEKNHFVFVVKRKAAH